MTMLETKKEIENALYNGNPLSFDAMINCYVALEYFLVNHNDIDGKIQIVIDEVK